MGINNLDLDNGQKVDFIKVVTTKKDESFTFVLQVAVTKTEKQDVAVILVQKIKIKKLPCKLYETRRFTAMRLNRYLMC